MIRTDPVWIDAEKFGSTHTRLQNPGRFRRARLGISHRHATESAQGVAARALLDSPPAPPETTMLRILAILPFLWAGAAFAAEPVFDVHVHLHDGEESLLAYEAEAEAAGIELAGLGAVWFGGPHQARPGEASDIRAGNDSRSEEHTSELQSLMCISYAVFCLKKK